MRYVEKIKALLAKASGTDNEHEAMAFLAKAEELMVKHQISLEDLDKDDPVGSHYRRESKNGSGDWPDFLYSACASYYGCQIVEHMLSANGMHRSREVFGRASAVITLNEMHPYLVKTVKRLGREYADEWNTKPDKAARRIGNALMARLYSLAAAASGDEAKTAVAKANALVTMDQISAMIARAYPKLTDVRQGKKYTSSSARSVASSINLSGQVGSSRAGLLG